MKFAAALSLGIAPVALAKAVHNVYPVRRDPSRGNKGESKSAARGIGVGINSGFNAAEAIAIEAAVLEAQTGLLVGSLNEVIVLWVNPGGNAATTSIIGSAPPAATGIAGVGVGAGQQVGAPPPVGVAGQGVGAGVTTTTPGVATGTVGGAGGATHSVTVGGPKGKIFEPSSLTAAVGDTVIFQFLSQNHTATQSAFNTPCVPLAGGMDTNFQANANNTVNPPPQVAMQIMAATPLWFHCRQNGHCGTGMTLSINPTAEKTAAMFQAMAIAQNGTGSGSAITGNGGGSTGTTGTGTGAGAGAGAGTGTGTGTGTGAGSSAVGVSSSESGLTATLGSLPTEATGTTGAAGASASGVVTGTGSVNPDGSCSCAVVCSGTGAFPAVQAQGVGAFGGVPGALPSSMVAVK